MDQPGSSRTHNDEIMDADMEDQPTTLKRTYPGDYDMEDSSSSDDSNGNYPVQSAGHSHISQCKKPRLNEYHQTSYFNNFRPEYDEPIYMEPIFVSRTSPNYPNINPTNYNEPGPNTFNNAETFIPGFWIQFTNIVQCWSFKCIKRYLRQQFGVTCMKGTPLPGAYPGSFRIIVKFTSSDERVSFLQELHNRRITQFFNHKFIDNLPIGSLETETDYEDYGSMYSSCEHLD